MHVRNGLGFVALALAVLISSVRAADPPAAPQPGPRAAEFARLFGQWKSLLADLGTMKIEYRKADETQRAELKDKWNRLIEKGSVMREQLLTAAEQAYIEAPDADQSITSLLAGVVHERIDLDDYENALPLARLLIDHQCQDPRIPVAGIAAFAIGDIDAAEKYLKLAEKSEPALAAAKDEGGRKLAQTSAMDRNRLPEFKKAWAKEQQLRQAEAKADDLPRVLIKTSQGEIEVELFENEAPNHVANFITLVEKGFYDGLIFHRVLPGFMAQGGDPKSDGTGGPGYEIPAEFRKPDHRLHFRGSLSMARAQDPDSAGSQFFLMFAPNGDLDGNYTVFGRMTKGFDVLAKIARIDPQSAEQQPKPDKIVEAKVLRKRAHEYVVKKTGG